MSYYYIYASVIKTMNNYVNRSAKNTTFHPKRQIIKLYNIDIFYAKLFLFNKVVVEPT